MWQFLQRNGIVCVSSCAAQTHKLVSTCVDNVHMLHMQRQLASGQLVASYACWRMSAAHPRCGQACVLARLAAAHVTCECLPCLCCLLILQARADLASSVHKRAAKMNGQLQLRSWRDLPPWAQGPMPLRSGAHSLKSSVATGGALRCMA